MRVMGIHQDGGVGLRSARWKAALVVLVVGALAEHALAQAPVCRFSKEITPIDCRRANLGSVVGSGATAGVSSGAWWALALAYGSGGVSPTFVESCSGGFDQVVEHFSAPGCSPVTFVSECRLDAEVHAGVGGAPGDYAEVLVAAGADGIVLPAVGLAIGARAAGVVLPPTTYTFAVNGIVPSLRRVLRDGRTATFGRSVVYFAVCRGVDGHGTGETRWISRGSSASHGGCWVESRGRDFEVSCANGSQCRMHSSRRQCGIDA